MIDMVGTCNHMMGRGLMGQMRPQLRAGNEKHPVADATGNYEAAAEVISGRIEKRHLNVRMWDMLAMISLKTANEKLVSNQAALMAKYNSTDNKLLSARFSRYKEEGWQQKVRNKDFKWDNLKI